MIRNKWFFVFGIFCACCFVANVVNGKDILTLIVSALGTISGIAIGLSDNE